MIKYVEFDAFDEYGQHVIPMDDLLHMNKTASGSYSPELMNVILNMKRKSDRYYVVINALGSHEVWGCNKNADSFPESGLIHKSLRSDIGTDQDYGYKTFEYHAKLFKHHNNKANDTQFGEVIFSHWNPVIHRVELIVAINMENAKDIVDALDKNQQVSVSMGCKVKHDKCSICNNLAATRAKYCKHLKGFLGRIIDANIAAQWSRELGKTVLPGTQVFAFNDKPKFFDISRVYVGADRTAYILGKAASDGSISYSADIAESMGVTDEMVDKISMVRKLSDMDKEIAGATGPADIDGQVSNAAEMDVIRKALDAKISKTIDLEPQIPKDILNSAATALPLKTIFSTMMGLGIHPKPIEFQRIVLVNMGEKEMADDLESKGIIFDTEDNSNPLMMDVGNSNFSDTLGKALFGLLGERSCFPSMLSPRIQVSITKTAAEFPWSEKQKKPMSVTPALGALAAVYAGLKLKAMGYGPKDLAAIFERPWLRALIGGSVVCKIYSEMSENKNKANQLPTASQYANGLQNTNLSGHIVKEAAGVNLGSHLGVGLYGGLALLPAAYVANSWNQKSLQETGRQIFPGAGIKPLTAAGVGTAGITAAHYYGSKIRNSIGKLGLKKL